MSTFFAVQFHSRKNIEVSLTLLLSTIKMYRFIIVSFDKQVKFDCRFYSLDNFSFSSSFKFGLPTRKQHLQFFLKTDKEVQVLKVNSTNIHLILH